MFLWTLALALATPPDVLDSRATVLCTGEHHVGMLFATAGNGGSHYVRTSQLELVRLDVRDGQLARVDHGREKASFIHFEEREPERTRTYPEAAAPLLEQLHDWGLDRCLEVSHTDTTLSLRAGEAPVLVQTLGEHTREQPARLLDPRGAFWGDPRPAQSFVEVELPEDTTEALSVVAHFLLKEHAVAHVRVVGGMDSFDLFVVVPRQAFLGDQARLLNQRGLDLHRAGEHEAAARDFARARRLDETFHTASFNLACAQAKRGNADAAVRALQEVPTEGLAKRVAGDADFDGVRADEAFVVFLGGLPP